MKVSTFFDSRKPIKSGENKGRCHIKILVEFDGDKRIRRYYQTQVFATRQEFEKIITGNFGRCTLADAEILEKKRKVILALERKAKDEAKPGIHPDDFEPKFRSKGSNDNPLDMLLRHSEELKADGQVGSAIFYKSAYSSFKKFCDTFYHGRLSFLQVTPRWLMQYERWLTDQGRSISTVGTHVRSMRTVFNKAIALQLIPMTMYPFGRNKYKCPTGQGRKIALEDKEKDIVLEYRGQYQKDVDLWIFSYLSNGMNFADIARIRRRSIVDGVLTFDRAKTKNTERNKVPMIITLHPEAVRIINKWGNADLSPNAYVFPVLKEGLSPTQEKYLIADWLKDVNAHLKLAVVEINEKYKDQEPKFEMPVITTYWARHTFAAILYRKGVSIEYIQELLGHSDTRTTKIYIGSLGLEAKRQISGLL